MNKSHSILKTCSLILVLSNALLYFYFAMLYIYAGVINRPLWYWALGFILLVLPLTVFFFWKSCKEQLGKWPTLIFLAIISALACLIPLIKGNVGLVAVLLVPPFSTSTARIFELCLSWSFAPCILGVLFLANRYLACTGEFFKKHCYTLGLTTLIISLFIGALTLMPKGDGEILNEFRADFPQAGSVIEVKRNNYEVNIVVEGRYGQHVHVFYSIYGGFMRMDGLQINRISQ